MQAHAHLPRHLPGWRARPHRRPFACRAEATGGAAVVTAPGLRAEPWSGTPDQLRALDELRRRMARSPYGCPDTATLQWYLRDRYFDAEESEKKLRSMLRWRQQLGPPGSITAEAVAAEAASGKAYVAERPDRYGRPAVVVRARRHVTGQYPLPDSKRYCAYLLDEAVARLPPPSGDASTVEQIVGLIDLEGFGPQNADFKFAAFMVEAFFEFYPRRVSQVLLVDAPWVFKPAWEVIRPLLRKYAALVSFASREQARALFKPGHAPPDFL